MTPTETCNDTSSAESGCVVLRLCVCVVQYIYQLLIPTTHSNYSSNTRLFCRNTGLFRGNMRQLWRHMGWLHVVGSLKLHVSVAEYRLLYRVLLQKRPIILRSLLIVATPWRAGSQQATCRLMLRVVDI